MSYFFGVFFCFNLVFAMPNKKKQRNAFFFFMLEVQERFAKKGRQYSMQEIANMANPEWQLMSLNEKQKYEIQALAHKLNHQKFGRLACDGMPLEGLSEEREMKEEMQRQMRHGIGDLLGKQESQKEFIANNTDKKLYFVSFNVLCRVKENDAYIPLEIGLVEYTIKDGIQKEYHTLINPGEIPKGYTGDAMRHSTSTHHIDVFGHEGSETDYYKIWENIMNLISPQCKSDGLPPLFCPVSDIKQNLSSLEWLADAADEDFPGIRVWDANFLHMELRAGAGSPAASYNSAEEELKKSSFDYTPGLKCEFHEAEDNVHCALRKVKAICCIISDVMCKLFNVTATEKHLPERASAVRAYEVVSPSHWDSSSEVGRGPSRSSNYSSRPGSAISDGPPRSYSRTSRSEEETRSAISSLDDFVNDDYNSSESDNESEPEYLHLHAGNNVQRVPLEHFGSHAENQNLQGIPQGTPDSSENKNPPRMPQQRTAGGSSGVQLRQPVSQSIALSLAYGKAPAVVPGQGVGRGQRRK